MTKTDENQNLNSPEDSWKSEKKLMKKKERQDKAEMEKKKLMIKEIRMLEAELIENKNNNKVQLDLTTTAGHELLGKIVTELGL